MVAQPFRNRRVRLRVSARMADLSNHPSPGDKGRAGPWGAERPAPPPARRDSVGTATAALVSVLATIVGLLFLAWLVLFVTKGRFLKHTFERVVSSYTQRQVKVAGDFNLYFDPIDVKFLAEGLTISNPAWAAQPNLWSSKLIDTRIETFPLIFGHKKIDWIHLVDGAAWFEWDKAHTRNTWTFGDPNKKGEPFQLPSIRRAEIDGTTLAYRDPQMLLSADLAFGAIRAQDTRFANTIAFKGGGTLRGRRFTVTGTQRSPNQLAAGGRNELTAHAQAGTDIFDMTGTLPGATQLEGSDLHVAARGRNLRDLFDLLGVVVPDTRAYHLKSDLTKAGREWRFTRLRGGYGQSDLAGTLTVITPAEVGGRLKLVADIASRSVDIVDIGPFIGYNPQVLASTGPTAAVSASAESKASYPRILPDAPLRSEALKNFDADVKYRVVDFKQPWLPVSNVHLTLALDRGLLTLSPLTADLAGGHVDSDISIDSRVPQVITKYDIRLSPTPIAKLMKGFGVSEAGTTGVLKARIKMEGVGNTLHDSLAAANGRIAVILPRGTFWTSYTELSEFDIGVFVQKMFEKKLKEPVQINCGLIGFTVRDGIAAADPILIDTTKNVMTAKGGFSFKDESLSLAFRADAKKFSLFSGQSPVGIGGHFAAPSIQIVTPQLLARGGIGVALGVLTPPAALLAFVDPGDAKAAQCGPVLAGADAAAQRTMKGQPRKDVGDGKTKEVKEEKKGKFLGL